MQNPSTLIACCLWLSCVEPLKDIAHPKDIAEARRKEPAQDNLGREPLVSSEALDDLGARPHLGFKPTAWQQVPFTHTFTTAPSFLTTLQTVRNDVSCLKKTVFFFVARSY